MNKTSKNKLTIIILVLMLTLSCAKKIPERQLVIKNPKYSHGGWLSLARQGLSPCKKHQALLGAPLIIVSATTLPVAEGFSLPFLMEV